MKYLLYRDFGAVLRLDVDSAGCAFADFWAGVVTDYF